VPGADMQMQCSDDIISIGNFLCYTPGTVSQAQSMPFCLMTTVHFVEVGKSSLTTRGHCTNLTISEIHSFCKYMDRTLDLYQEKPIIICSEDSSKAVVGNACLLSGAYLILRFEVNMEHVLNVFNETLQCISTTQLQDHLEITQETQGGPMAQKIKNCWNALARAKGLRWLGTALDVSESLFDVEMAEHYASPINGNVHMLVPAKLLLFPTPKDLHSQLSWCDERAAEPGQPSSRRFSAAFLADLLADMETSAVFCIGHAAHSDATAFNARGIDVIDLAIDARQPALLHAMDRLLTLSRASPGPVALFNGASTADIKGSLQGIVATLAAAWLMRDFEFTADAAAAWIWLVCPGLHTA
jgi:hypothetical protein